MKQIEYEKALLQLAQGNEVVAEQLLGSALPHLAAVEGGEWAQKAAQHLLRILLEGGRLTEALQVLDELLGVKNLAPKKRGQLLATRANLYSSLGNITQAVSDMELALTLMPGDERMTATLATWRSASRGTPAMARADMLAWAKMQVRQRPDERVRLHPRRKSSFRRIRVGYVSGDFRNHAVRHFIEPVLRHHDHARFEVHAFMTGPEDELTEQLKPLLDHWHDVNAWSDERLFDAIQVAGIDVLVDLSGHTEGARLGVFARRAAPVQVTWFGYMGTLGLPEMDWRFSDAFVTRAEEEAWHTEKIWRLSSVYAFQPPATRARSQVRLPAEENGYITMVCLNHSRKLSDSVLQLWAQLLRANPKCGLILISADKSVEYAPVSLNERLLNAGLPMEQVTVVPRLSTEVFMSLSSVADFALDTFPASGGTTTLLAMSMGMPVLALDEAGAAPMATLSARLLQQADLSNCVVHTQADYLLKAEAWIHEPQTLIDIRSSLDSKLSHAPCMRHEAITREVESAYRQMLLNSAHIEWEQEESEA